MNQGTVLGDNPWKELSDLNGYHLCLEMILMFSIAIGSEWKSEVCGKEPWWKTRLIADRLENNKLCPNGIIDRFSG